MESISIDSYIIFGTELRYLQDVSEGCKVHGKDLILENIDRFISHLKEFKLPVTQRATYKLMELRDKLKKKTSIHALTSEEASRLREIMESLRLTLMAEAGGNVAFIVTDKRIDVNKLLSDVPALMSPGVFDLLPDIARYDFSEGAKCIAFELPTAAALHLLRGTEAVLRKFYCSFVKRNRVDLLWGPMVQHLRSRKKGIPQVLLDNLDNIRRSFRNPTQHPDKIYDIQEAQDLFSLCVEVVNRMASHRRSQ